MIVRGHARSRWLCALLLSAALAAGDPGRAQASPPAIVFTSETCDLGSVVQGEQPVCTFDFSNAGTESLRVLQVEPTCGCTTALLSEPLLRTGEHGIIRVVFDSENFSGEIVKEVEVRSNDAARPSLTLRVQSIVEPEIDFEPRVATFDGVRAGTALRQIVMLTNRRAEPVRILRLEAEPSSYGCQIRGWTDTSRPLVLESWDRVAIDVLFSPPGPLAMAIAGLCTLDIEGPRKRHFRLKLLALP